MNKEIITNQIRNPKESNSIPTEKVISSASKSIDDMTNWEIFIYLQEEREWMVIPAFTRKDYEDNFSFKFKSKEEWRDFTTSMCDNIIVNTIGAIVE